MADRQRVPKPSPERWCSAQRIQIIMTASGSHTLMYRWLEEPDEVAYNFLRIHERASRGGHWPPAFYADFQRKWGCLKKTKCPNRRTVIANQSADWCGNPLPKPSPPGKVARASPASARRMRALLLPYGRGAPDGAERARVYPLSHFVTAPPEWEPREKRIATPVCGLVRNDMRNTKCI